MRIDWSRGFSKEYRHLSKDIQEKFEEKIQLFVENTRHPSLRIKKMSGTDNIWEASINKNYRWTFEWMPDCIRLRHIGTHDILQRE